VRLLPAQRAPASISDFTARRIDDAIAGIAPEAVVTIERVAWLE
jgi:hypothetical protein